MVKRKIFEMKTRLLIAILLYLVGGVISSYAQEYKIQSFMLMPEDLTARVGQTPRVDNNGVKCAILKILVSDVITGAEGNVFGDIVSKGMEKWVYVTNNTKRIKLNFQNHFPLTINFADYNYPMLTGQMVYVVKLVEDESASPIQASSQTNASREDDILSKAIAAYENDRTREAIELFRSISNNLEAQDYLVSILNPYIHTFNSDDVTELKKLAAQGIASSQYALGILYKHGQIVPRDDNEARYWFQKAARQGNYDAFNALGSDAPRLIEQFIKFNENSTDVPKREWQKLTDLSKTLRALNYDVKIEICGWKKSDDSDADKLAWSRAFGIKNLLLKNGVNPDNISVTTSGLDKFGIRLNDDWADTVTIQVEL